MIILLALSKKTFRSGVHNKYILSSFAGDVV